MSRRAWIDERLADVPLFRGLSRKQLGLVARRMTPIDWDAGKVLMEQGDVGRELVIIVEGTVEIVRDGVVIATRGPGAVLGEISLLTDRRRTATAIATTPVSFEVLDRREFAEVLDENPELAGDLEATMRQRLEELAATDE